MNAFSDTMITLSAIAPFAQGPTTIRTAHTRLQETDRLRAVETELNRLGIRTQTTLSSIRIIPGRYGLALYRRTATTGWRWHLR